MIIDCHGHYTTAPQALGRFRDRQLARLIEPSLPKLDLSISDDEIRDSLESNQIRLQNERGIDMILFSPMAAGMAHHCGPEATSIEWTRVCNDLIHRVTSLYPTRFAAVCQLPQSPGVSPGRCAAELERCVEQLGFVGCNINPDPTDGYWSDPPLTDRYWYPLYEKMVELDVPAMVHVSCSCNPNFHHIGAHYINGDTTAFMQFLSADLFRDFPSLRFVIPHGGGAVPYHWGRYRGLAQNMGKPLLEDHLLNNVFFDTCVYHQAGIDLLTRVIPVDNILFASEMIGGVRGIDPQTGRNYDETIPMLQQTDLNDEDRQKVFSGNALRVYPRLAAHIHRHQPDVIR
jgi:4-oxalmesaconate hydratase